MVQTNCARKASSRKTTLKQKGKEKNMPNLVFQDCIRPAPMSIKPFSSLINPFQHGCSIFCNHPTKNIELKMAIEKTKRKRIDDEREAEMMGQILEDIICKYGTKNLETETNITSPESEVLPPPRPQLILNLRRTTSQETGRTSGGFHSTFSPSPSSLSGQNVKVDSMQQTIVTEKDLQAGSRSEEEEEEGKTEIIKRRGKVRKKKKKINVAIEKGEKEVVDLTEPNDTMVSTCKGDGIDYESEDLDIEKSRAATRCASSHPTPPLMESDLFDNRTLRHLRRNLSITNIEAEFRKIWKRVLQEALGANDTLPHNEIRIDEIQMPPCEPEKWLCYPRTFKRSNSRFDLPINKKILSQMRPLIYLKEYVSSSKSSFPLYNHVFNKYKEDNNKIIPIEVITDALGEVMGRVFEEDEAAIFRELVDIKEEDEICLKTWIGLCAFSERLFGEKFSSGKPEDCGERDMIEILDFECLQKRKPKLDLNVKITNLLNAIQNS